ncbi:MAG: GTPase Era [Alphaproteobacteria bacterium]|jgi:GTPase|nr:GTPase Era [Rhodospirillaceae bacterium]MBT6203699.1 GTPase Era [Rhodospirillaceae bacterium]MBT6509051.1 GTPase Era [Rhodospirillaceae bacterium]MBT7612507.1 GTPase Era [Rhodospirillaceae bacterium]MDG2479629.1 GTPase Era [Alphaproteobacteria bacterium]
MTEDPTMRCGFVAVFGPPNAGKSTLVNAIVGAKVSIVTHKVQTTRGRVMGIRNIEGDQLVFVDTPGIFKPKKRLERALVDAAWSGADDADMTLLMVDAAKGMNKELVSILERLKARNRKTLVAINKIDMVAKNDLFPLGAAIDASGVADEIFYISALKGEGVDGLVATLRSRISDGPWMFPDDQVSDLPLRQMASEITREKLFLRVHQELPYELSVETEMWTEIPEEKAVRIDQVIYVARDGHKPILLGKGGRTIKDVGIAARKELEDILEMKVHLFLHVKVRTNWLNDPARYREMGLEFPK